MCSTCEINTQKKSEGTAAVAGEDINSSEDEQEKEPLPPGAEDKTAPPSGDAAKVEGEEAGEANDAEKKDEKSKILKNQFCVLYDFEWDMFSYEFGGLVFAGEGGN